MTCNEAVSYWFFFAVKCIFLCLGRRKGHKISLEAEWNVKLKQTIQNKIRISSLKGTLDTDNKDPRWSRKERNMRNTSGKYFWTVKRLFGLVMCVWQQLLFGVIKEYYITVWSAHEFGWQRSVCTQYGTTFMGRRIYKSSEKEEYKQTVQRKKHENLPPVPQNYAAPCLLSHYTGNCVQI